MIFIFFILLSLLINIDVFLPFFNLGLFGDDWLTIFRYFYYLHDPKHLGPYSSEYFNNFKYLLNAYGAQDTIMATLYTIFGQQSPVYFIVSYSLRIIAGLSIYLPAFYITKNKWASYFGVLFFLFSASGIEASGWVFNMPSYLTIIFFSVFIYLYLKAHQEKNKKSLFLSYAFFLLSFVSNLIRSHGLIPFVIFLEIYWLISEKTWKGAKLALVRVSGFLLIFILIYILGLKETISGNTFSALASGFTTISNTLSQGRFDFLFYPIVTLGSLLIPDSFISYSFTITSLSQYVSNIFLPIFIIYFLAVIIFTKSVKALSPRFLSLAILGAFFWSSVVIIVYKSNLATFSNSKFILLLLIGGYFLTFILSLATCLTLEKLARNVLVIALGWTVISFFYPWWTNSSFIYLTTHRYLIIPSMGVSLLFAVLIGLGKNTKEIFLLFILSNIFLLLHASSTQNYIKKQYQAHNRETVKKIWSQMPNIPNIATSKQPYIFYFEGDSTNGDILHDTITFGFPFHMGLIYNINDLDKIPSAIDSWEEIISAIKDGQSLKKYGIASNPVPLENVYVFRLEGSDRLMNLTEQTKQKLKNFSK